MIAVIHVMVEVKKSNMAKKQRVLQKFALIMAVVSIALSIVAGVMFYLRVESVGSDNPISGSLLASTIFFVSVGVILVIMGKADLPSLEIDRQDDKQTHK